MCLFVEHMSLDAFLPPSVVKPKSKPKQENLVVQERCSNPKCGKLIPLNEPTYTLRIKGVEKVFCADCAREKLGKGKPT